MHANKTNKTNEAENYMIDHGASDMRSLLARLADVAGVDGDGLAPPGAEVAQGKGGVEAQPVQALRAQPPEVLAVALFAVPAVAAHLGEVYLAWYDHV